MKNKRMNLLLAILLAVSPAGYGQERVVDVVQTQSLSLEAHEQDDTKYLLLRINGVAQRLNLIPAGSFMMGSPKTEQHRHKRDETLHHVTLTKDFWMADTECSQALWATLRSENPSHFKGANRPVESLSWFDAIEFIRLLNKLLKDNGHANLRAALPTEAQWEYACRAGAQTAYSWGDEFVLNKSNVSNVVVSPRNEKPDANVKIFKQLGLPVDATMPVKTFEPNAWGLYDMHGNVFEWCRDSWGPHANGPAVDPVNEEPGPKRVVRGGGWRYTNKWSRCAYRWGDPAEPGGNGLGFRFILEQIP